MTQVAGARGWRRWFATMPFKTILLATIVFAVPTAITLNLKHEGERSSDAITHLVSSMTELRVQDGLEWRAISGRVSQENVLEKLTASRQSADEHLKEAVGLGMGSEIADRIAVANRRYSEAVDEELRLIASGDLETALELDETQVDPAFDAAATAIENETKQLTSAAVRTQALSDAGVLLTVLLSMILISVVQSRRRRAEVRRQTTEQNEARYRALVNRSSDLVLVVDRAGVVTFLSPAGERWLARPSQAPLTATSPAATSPAADGGLVDFIAAVDPQDRERLLTALQVAVPGAASVGEFRIAGRLGLRTFEVSVQDLCAEPSVNGIVLTAHDVTNRLKLQRQIEHRAMHDTLTGLPNRALLSDLIEQALLVDARDGTSTGLLLLDVDRFKEVNDTFGHQYGDQLLRQIGQRLVAGLRSIDTVARLGGDEFAVLLPDIRGIQDATEVAGALLDALTVPISVDNVEMDVEASVGVVISGEHGQDAVTLLQRADIAMYVAKAHHMGIFVYDPAVDENSAAKLAMVGDLRRALDREELVLYYQPQVCIGTGELLGVEALVRWQHPVHGLIFPDAFIPLAERTGLIDPLTRYVLDAALRQSRAWLDAGHPLKIAVNLSARNLHDEDLASQVADLLAVHDVPAALLELEVTESAIMSDPIKAGRVLKSLAALGTRLSIDDFGTGQTSLSQLTSLPFSEIKIDRSFVTTMTDNAANALIVSSVIDLGHNLGLTLVAEGVETEAALTALEDLGCDTAQGYYLSRPIPADAFETWRTERLATPVVS